ncbi:MAG: citrate synthase [Bacteroidetes bacterium]|nr:citrate synthase [Bacteroidota bacterium]
MSTEPNVQAKPELKFGLEGVIALESHLCMIDGQQGILLYRGYDIDTLAKRSTFEETAYLLWYGRLPKAEELEELTRQLQANRQLPEAVLDFIRQAPPKAEPMDVLRTAISLLALYDPDVEDFSPEASLRKAIRLTAQTPTIIAAFHRSRQGLEIIPPLPKGSTAHNFLYMLNGAAPDPDREHIFDVCLILHAEHGLNASTFTARVIASTQADMHAAVTGAIGALKGPLHGGANTGVMEMLLELNQSGADIETWIKDKLARKERIMGFGHRVYKTVDPRAIELRALVAHLAETNPEAGKWLQMAQRIQEVMKREKGLDPNVDFYSAPVYYTLGIPLDLFTTIFAMARMVGWTAHLMEQYANNRLIRPRAAYVGPMNLEYVPIAER